MCTKLLLLFALLLPQESIVIDKLAATVNDQIIAVSDIEKSIAFFPILRRKGESEKDFYFHVLDDLINQKAVFLEYRNDFSLNEDDYEQVQIPALQKAGSMESLRKLLLTFDMSWQDFRDFIKEKAFYEKVIREKVPLKIVIPFEDIERFYNQEYLPLQQSLELKPNTLVEMAPVIEKYLRQVETDLRLADWLKEIRTGFRIEIKLRSNHEPL